MSQARITLRPPPNVEFIQGYPGIPGNGGERPTSEVQGTIELRLGSQSIKAKWVQVELRKVETLPGGGQANTFYDYVGQSPVRVWGSDEEWHPLNTRDFPFSIRIPESIPPSIALEKNAGIKYELVAKVCMKGKKGLFRRKADPTLSTMTPIIIDKHELHSTWPVYSQPESRSVGADRSLLLTVDRTHTCYGPGDRVSVIATFKNDAVSVVDLRAFEYMVKETVIFRRPATGGQTKKGAPLVKITHIGEQKVPMNQTVYGGQLHRAELSCIIPQSHNTTTVNAARYIDIAYSICVRAILGAGSPLLLELPVTISNWPRNMSLEAVRRIGPSAGLSLLPPNAHMSIQPLQAKPPAQQRPGSSEGRFNPAQPRPGMQQPPSNLRPYSIAERVGSHGGPPADTMSSTQGYNSTGMPGGNRRQPFDEFGQAVGPDRRPVPASYAGHNRTGSSSGAGGVPNGPPDTRRPQVINTQPANRLTLVNADHRDEDSPSDSGSPRRYLTAAEEKRQLQNAQSTNSLAGRNVRTISESSVPQNVGRPSNGNVDSSVQSSPPRKSPWPTAEEEKARLFNKARLNAEQVQANLGNAQFTQKLQQTDSGQSNVISSPQPQRVVLPQNLATASASMPDPTPMPSSPPKKQTPWPTAEEEKTRLYNAAQRTAMRTQAMAAGVTPPDMPQQYGSGSGSNSYFTPVEPSRSTGAALYQSAMASVNRANDRPLSPPAASGPRYDDSPPKPRTQFPSAEEEKSALRYYEAKRAVDRRQNMGNYRPTSAASETSPSDDLIAYDSLYPNQQSSGSGSRMYTDQNVNGMSGPSNSQQSYIATPPEHPYVSQDIPSYQPPPPSQASIFTSAMAEKERLRRRFEMEDAAGSSSGSTPAPFIVNGSGSPPPSPPTYGGQRRAQPVPPVNPNAPRQLSAAEEKARLRAQYEAEEAASHGENNSNSVPAYSQPPPEGSSSNNAYHFSEGQDSQGSPYTSPPPPPPLAPRPPMHYIEETEQEDFRSQAEDHVMTTVMPNGLQIPQDPRMDFGLPFRPFSPLDLGNQFGPINRSNQGSPHQTPGGVPPPPLPPKIPIFD